MMFIYLKHEKREFMINEKYQMTLDDTLVLRGMSILIIILHNYIHRFSNVVLENQHVYYPERNKELINSFLEFDSGLFLDLISHYLSLIHI